jgi:hypothetical protein
MGKTPTVFRSIQVRNRGSSYAQVCTQFIQGNTPMDPDRLCVWGEKIGITGGYPGLSTRLSPPVDNFINRRRANRLRLTIMATIKSVPGDATW